MALPVILAGIRVSAVAIMATAPLMSIVGGGTLGTYILSGLALSDEVQVFAAALLVALLAMLTEIGFALLERRITSPGLTGADAGTTMPQRVFGRPTDPGEPSAGEPCGDRGP